MRGEFDMCYQHYRLDRVRAGDVPGGSGLGSGGYARFAKITAPRLMRVPDGLDDRAASAVEPAAVGFHGVRLSGMKLGDRVAILGAGPIGLYTLQCALLAGARDVVVAELSPKRAALARDLGARHVLDPRNVPDVPAAFADALGAPPDVVFDAAGVPATLQQAVDIVKPGGSVMMVGVSFDPAPIRPSSWVTRRVTVRASFAYSREDYAATIALLEQRRLLSEPLISRVVPASQTAEAFDSLLHPNDDIKVLVDPKLER
jgi:(R,R)-butanediol dehydrogenase/meso-butanediol dehydrogenase/diacetyl reductase